jgi:hypothetical protein
MSAEHEKKPKTNGANMKEITLEVFGVAMLLEKKKKIVFVDGRKPRISFTDGKSIIPPHMPFIAFRPGSYESSQESKMSFSYDVNGDGKTTRFEGFLLDGHVVSFERVVKGEAALNDGSIAPMTALGSFELCPGVLNGTNSQIVATLDVSNATDIAGTDHGDQVHAISFGSTVRNWAEKITVTFKAKGAKPTLLLKKNGKTDLTVTLKGDGPWTIMTGNVPPEEVMNVSLPGEIHDNVPLTHVELLFDFYHMPAAAMVGVPKPPACTNHAHAHVAGARIAGSGVHCGPPVRSGG